MAEINPIKFSRELQKVLYPDNAFYKKSMTEGGIGADVTKVEIPIAGRISAAKSGDPILPLQVEERTDDVKEYPVEQIYVKPFLIRHENEIVINYNKRQDMISQIGSEINLRAADIAAVNWGTDPANTDFIVRTTSTTARTTSLVNGTGTRKRVAYNDLVAVKTRFNRMNLPAGGSLYALWTPDMIEDLFLIDKLTDMERIQIANVRNGEVGIIFGFKSMMRWNEDKGSNGLVYNVDATIKRTIDEANQATDNAAAIFWHSGLVRHAEGNAKTNINRDKAEYLGGTIMSATTRFGATQNRKDGKGVVSLVEQA